jgi:outer membrane receptor protein involved in Fe transport
MRKRLFLRKKLLASLISAAVAATAVPATSWAQTADATLRGKAPANGDVTAKNVATGAIRRTKSAADGSYSLVGLPPGTYRVDAGPGTEQTVTLTVASTATLDLQAAAAATAAPAVLEGLSVNATTLREVKTSEIGTTISLHQIETIPQITRNFLEFADTVPGMIFSVDPSGHTKLTGGAQNANSVNVYIDGVGQKNYVKEGGVAGQFATQGNPFPQLAIGEYKVITSNYKAEYDQISSAAVTAETKSGTNDFHGEVFGTYTDQNYRADTPAETAAGKQTPSQEKEYGFALGGPIIQDAMHFFFTYEAKRFDTPITVVPSVTGVTAFLPANVQSQLGPSGLPFTEDLYFGKIDWEFTDRDRIELSSKVRKEDQTDNIGTGQAESASIDVKNNDTRVDARWQHSADSWFNELLFTYEKTFNAPSSLGFGNGAVYTTSLTGQADQTIITTGPASPLATQNKGQKGPAIQDDLTFSNLNWMGDHTVKMGAKYKDVKLTAQDAEDINPQFFYDVTTSGTAILPYKAFFTNPVPGESPVATSRNKQFGTYIQDDWAVNDKLTLNLGVRWDYEETPSFLNYVTPANVVAALNSPNPDPTAPAGQTYAQALALGGVNINDYISNGNNRKSIKNEWQPRVGFSYDLNGDEDHVIFGGAGRAYDRDLFDYLQLEETKAALPEFTVFFRDPMTGQCHGNGSPCVDFNPAFLNGLSNLQGLVSSSNIGKEVDLLNNNLKAPYSDQFSIGMRNKVGDWNTSATVARIVSKDGFVFTLGNRYPNGAFFMNGGQPWGNGVPGFGSLIIGSNGVETRSNQLLLSADKPYTKESHWGATFAYTYTDATQNRDINEHYSFDEETIHQYPFIDSNAAPKHRFVATGSIDGGWGMVYSGKLTLATPTPLNTFSCYTDGSVLFPTGSHCTPSAVTPGGQSVGFGGKALGYRDIDFQATKDFDLSRGMTLYVRFDVLNVFNFKNYTDVNLFGNSVLTNVSGVYNRTGNITGTPREFKITAGFRF